MHARIRCMILTRFLSIKLVKKNVENLKSLWNEKWFINKDLLNLNQNYI